MLDVCFAGRSSYEIDIASTDLEHVFARIVFWMSRVSHRVHEMDCSSRTSDIHTHGNHGCDVLAHFCVGSRTDSFGSNGGAGIAQSFAAQHSVDLQSFCHSHCIASLQCCWRFKISRIPCGLIHMYCGLLHVAYMIYGVFPYGILNFQRMIALQIVSLPVIFLANSVVYK